MYSSPRFGWYGSKPGTGPVSTPLRRDETLGDRAACEADAALALAGRRLGRATAAGRVVFLELVARFRGDFLEDFPAIVFFPEADLFLVTFFPTSFRLDEDFPACFARWLTAFPFAAGRLLELPAEVLFELFFLEAAFFFGIR